MTAEIKKMVLEIDPVNAEYILKDHGIQEEAERHRKYEDEGRSDMAEFVMERLIEKIREFGQRRLLPSNAKVGDGATICYWSDREAGTIVKVTRKSITVQRDKATLSPDFKPEFIPGGFAGTVINQHEQSYTYEPDPSGRKMTFYWSDKYQSYGQPGSLRAIKGRHEFYDYNF